MTRVVEIAAVEADDEEEVVAGETGRNKFLRLGPKRVEAAINRLRLVGNLAGYGYEYTPEEVKKLQDALFDAVHDVRRRFEKEKTPRVPFSF